MYTLLLFTENNSSSCRKKAVTNFLSDSPNKRNAAQKAEELRQLRAKRQTLLAKRAERSDGVKIETIKTYLALGGNVTLTAASMGIHRDTLQRWKRSVWWSEVIAALRKEEKLLLSSNAKKLLKVSMEGLADRLANGDHVYNQKTGELIRKPVAAKDLHKISTDLMERTEVLDKATEEAQVVQGNDDKLASLAERFAALAVKAAEKNARITSDDIVDVEVKHIVVPLEHNRQE